MTPILRIEDLTVSYHRIPAVHHLNIQLPGGSLVGLLGPKGAGKTSLLKAIAGLLPLETGHVKISVPGGRSVVAYVPQREAVDWDFPLTVRALVEMGRYGALGPWRAFGANDAEIVEEAMSITALAPLAQRQINALSGGQQQRAFLARALAQQATIYLLDEPFTGLDANGRKAFSNALRHLRALGKLVIASHHDLNSVPELFDQVILLNGELVAAGSVADAFTPETISRAYSTTIFSGAPTPT